MKRFIFICFLILTLNNFAQELSFENLQLKGLPSSEVHQIAQDKDGFIWMATDAGLCKYDGNKLITYTVKDGISENVVLKIRKDNKKRLWFLTLSGYFFYLENGRFIQIAANDELMKLFTTYPLDFMVSEKDTLFICNGGKYLFAKVPPQNNYKTVIKQYDTLCKQNIRHFFIQNKTNPKEAVALQSNSILSKDSTFKFYIIDSIVT
ncbi:MAG TPA: two-component regulator propeller domain-containing protein, partial [Bacteroidia bacterium]|nr:two-component regulator propeller domain-containing protein [Bacteroidia bacterium]